MKIQKANMTDRFGAVWTVSVDPGELVVDSGKALPYATTIGTFNSRGTVKVWTPAAYKPNGYPAAARRMLERAARSTLKGSGGGSLLERMTEASREPRRSVPPPPSSRPRGPRQRFVVRAIPRPRGNMVAILVNGKEIGAEPLDGALVRAMRGVVADIRAQYPDAELDVHHLLRDPKTIIRDPRDLVS